MRKVEAAWLASAIDGEGWVFESHGTKGSPFPRVTVGVCGTNKEYVERASKIMGCSIWIQKRYKTDLTRKKIIHSKVLWKTEVRGHQKSLVVLNAVLPFLIIKKQKAEAAIQFIKSREWGRAWWKALTPKQRSLQLKKSWKTRRKIHGPSGMRPRKVM